MREFCVEEELKKKLNKLFKKNKVLYEATMKKIEEIIHCEDVDHYKNLRRLCCFLRRGPSRFYLPIEATFISHLCIL